MDGAREIRGRTFSVGAQGYDQGDVEAFLRDLAIRVEGPDCDWAAEAERVARPEFRAAALGYWRPEVDAYLVELHGAMRRRAEEAVESADEGAPGDAATAADVVAAAAAPGPRAAGRRFGIFRRRDEPGAEQPQAADATDERTEAEAEPAGSEAVATIRASRQDLLEALEQARTAVRAIERLLVSEIETLSGEPDAASGARTGAHRSS